MSCPAQSGPIESRPVAAGLIEPRRTVPAFTVSHQVRSSLIYPRLPNHVLSDPVRPGLIQPRLPSRSRLAVSGLDLSLSCHSGPYPARPDRAVPASSELAVSRPAQSFHAAPAPSRLIQSCPVASNQARPSRVRSCLPCLVSSSMSRRVLSGAIRSRHACLIPSCPVTPSHAGPRSVPSGLALSSPAWPAVSDPVFYRRVASGQAKERQVRSNQVGSCPALPAMSRCPRHVASSRARSFHVRPRLPRHAMPIHVLLRHPAPYPACGRSYLHAPAPSLRCFLHTGLVVAERPPSAGRVLERAQDYAQGNPASSQLDTSAHSTGDITMRLPVFS